MSNHVINKHKCFAYHQHSSVNDGSSVKFEVNSSPTVKDGVYQQSTLQINAMDCPTEENLIRKKLATLNCVKNISFNLLQRTLTVEHEPASLAQIMATLSSLGFVAELAEEKTALPAPIEQSTRQWWVLLLAIFLALSAEIIAWTELPSWLALGCSLSAIGLVGLLTYRKGIIALANADLNINALMSIAVTGALLIGHWSEAAMVMVLFTIAEKIEAKSLQRASKAIASLVRLVPKAVTVKQPDGQWQTQAATEVTIGSIVRVKPGESIGLDGQIIQGNSSVNQASITGESLPVDKEIGDEVFAGTINETGSFDYRVTAAAKNTLIAKIIQVITQAQSMKAPTQRLVDKFAKIYTPAVLIMALIVAIVPPLVVKGDWLEWLYNALVLLVIACPCALVIAMPITVVSGLAAAAKHGILIKGGVYLELGNKLKHLALDKTGTITYGKPKLTDFMVMNGDEAEAHRLAVSLAVHSDHPISKAIAQSAGDKQLYGLNSFTALPGRGTQGEINGKSYWLGNHRLIHELQRCSAALEKSIVAYEMQGKTVVLLATEEEVVAIIAVADTIKATSREAVKELHRLGVETSILSGDNSHTVEQIAAQVAVDRSYGNLLPADKQQKITQLSQLGVVGMVGDGINDAPALARADIGFAMGVMGSDVAIETAAVALMDDDLGKIASFIRLSRQTVAVMWQNIALALGAKLIFILLTLAGHGSMWAAVFADVGVSLIVVANGLRLLTKK